MKSRQKKIHFDIITSLPGVFAEYLSASMLWKAQKNKVMSYKIVDLRDYTNDNHKTIDGKPFGGGAGMILRVEPIYKALRAISNYKFLISNSKSKVKSQKSKIRTIIFSAAGKRVTQKDFVRWSKYDRIVMICGRYEGVDERVNNFIDEEVSIGDYVLTGGELPAMIVVDGVTRLLPGVLGNVESLKEESHSDEGVLEYPQYTRPEVFTFKSQKSKVKSLKVPGILLSGNHTLIAKWRDENRKKAKSQKLKAMTFEQEPR